MFSKRRYYPLPSFELDLDDLDGAGLWNKLAGNGVLVAWREGETTLYSFSGSACANFGFSEKKTLAHLEYVQVFWWVSRDIALDVAIMRWLNYFIKSLKRWNLLVKSAV